MKRLCVLLTLVSFLLTACGDSPTPDLDATIQAAVAATLAAPEAATSGVPTIALTDMPDSPVETPAPPASAGPGQRLCPDPQPPLVTDLDVRQHPDLPEPPARAPFRDPVFGTCLVRVTDRYTDLSPDDESAGLKNEYARVQSFNADGSRILVRSIDAVSRHRMRVRKSSRRLPAVSTICCTSSESPKRYVCSSTAQGPSTRGADDTSSIYRGSTSA